MQQCGRWQSAAESSTSGTVSWFATHVKKTRGGGAASRTCGEILKCSESQGGRLDPHASGAIFEGAC